MQMGAINKILKTGNVCTGDQWRRRARLDVPRLDPTAGQGIDGVLPNALRVLEVHLRVPPPAVRAELIRRLQSLPFDAAHAKFESSVSHTETALLSNAHEGVPLNHGVRLAIKAMPSMQIQEGAIT